MVRKKLTARASDRRNDQVKQYKKVMALSQKVGVNELKRLHVTVSISENLRLDKGLGIYPLCF